MVVKFSLQYPNLIYYVNEMLEYYIPMRRHLKNKHVRNPKTLVMNCTPTGYECTHLTLCMEQ